MKAKAIIVLSAVFFSFMLGCSPAHVRGKVNKTLFIQNPTIAVASNDMLAEAIAGELMIKGFRIVERTSLNSVLSEKLISLSGLTEEDQMVSAGKLLKVDILLFVKSAPSPLHAGKIESAVVRLVEIKNGELVGIFSYQNGRAGAPGSPADAGRKESLPESAERIAQSIMADLKK